MTWYETGACRAQVHERFFGASAGSGQQDVRDHLQALRADILSGCRITFSRIIPRDDPLPEAHDLWQLAEQVGRAFIPFTGPC